MMMKQGSKQLLVVLLVSGFVMTTTGSVLAEASFDAKADRIEYKGNTTIEDIFKGVADPKIISREELPAKTGKPNGKIAPGIRYSYTIHRDIFGQKGSTLLLKEVRLVFAGDRNITSEGRIEIANAEIVPSKSGEQWFVQVMNPKGVRGWDLPPQRGLIVDGLKANGGRVEAKLVVYDKTSVKSPVTVANSSFSDFVFRLADLSKQYSIIGSETMATLENVTFRNIHLEGEDRTVYAVYQGLIQLGVGSVIRNLKVFDFSHTLRRTSAVAAILSSSAHQMTVENAYIEVDAGCGLHQHAVTTASHYKNITLVGKKVPTGGNPNAGHTTQISVGYSRYGHRGQKSGENIDKLENMNISTFRMGVQANTSCGLEMNNFKIRNCERAIETGLLWILNKSEISYGDRIDPRTYKDGAITDVQYGYWLHGTAKKASNDGAPVPAEWGNVGVFSENVKITASKAAIMTDYHSGHEFSALNDTYQGEIRIREQNHQFHLNLVNTQFDRARTFVEGKDSYVKDFRLLTVKVLDAKGKPVPGAKVTITSDDGGEVANARGQTQKDFLTGKDGLTAVAVGDAQKCPAMLAWRKTPEGEKKDFTYTVTVAKDGQAAAISDLRPGKIIDYRKAENTVEIRLP